MVIRFVFHIHARTNPNTIAIVLHVKTIHLIYHVQIYVLMSFCQKKEKKKLLTKISVQVIIYLLSEFEYVYEPLFGDFNKNGRFTFECVRNPGNLDNLQYCLLF